MFRSFAAFATLLLTATVLCADTRQLAWSDLIDQSAQAYEDPYRDLTYDQLDDLRTVVRLRSRLNDDEISEEARPKIKARLVEAEAAFAAAQIDIDWLLGQRWVVAERRERAASAGNPELDGDIVTLAGFAIAGPPEDDGTSVVYLVAERGMCSHVPPPAPNQMLRVRLTGDWKPTYIHEPVRISGRLFVDPTEHVFRVVDGLVPMRATFRMDAHEVETAKQLRAIGSKSAATSEGDEGLAARLRATGQRGVSQGAFSP